AGMRRAVRIPIMAITTKSSTSVNAPVRRASRGRRGEMTNFRFTNAEKTDFHSAFVIRASSFNCLARFARPTWTKCPAGRNRREDRVMRRRHSPKAGETRGKWPLSPLLARVDAVARRLNQYSGELQVAYNLTQADLGAVGAAYRLCGLGCDPAIWWPL